MGELGKLLPKPAWPLFETTLLGAQIEFAIALGCRKIFVNTHHLHEKLKNSLSSKYNSYVTFIFEKEILGSGGSIHNLIEKKFLKTNRLLTLNSDTFFFLSDFEELEKRFIQLSDNRCLLMGANISSESSYREMVVEDGYLKGLDDFSKKNNFITYAGMGLINLEEIVPHRGESNFFDSVADFKKEPVKVVSVPKSEFWDFGTKEYYKKNVYKLIEAINGKEETFFTKFLQERNLVDLKKIGKMSYNARVCGRVNFTSSHAFFEEVGKRNVIVIEAGEESQIFSI